MAISNFLSPNFERTARQSGCGKMRGRASPRSEEHTSELQSQSNLVCRLLLEKKKKNHDDTKESSASSWTTNPSLTSFFCSPRSLQDTHGSIPTPMSRSRPS